MNAQLWWEKEAWGSNLIDFLVAVKSFEGTHGNAADNFIDQTVKENIRYESRGIQISPKFLLEAYDTLGTPPPTGGSGTSTATGFVAELERGSTGDAFNLWHTYVTLFGQGGVAERRANALLAYAEWTDEQVRGIIRTLARTLHGKVTTGDNFQPHQVRDLAREMLAGSQTSGLNQWSHLLVNPHIVRTSASGEELFYENMIAGVLESARTDKTSRAFEAFVWMAWNPSTPKATLKEAYELCRRPSVKSTMTATWAELALKEALNPRNLAHYQFKVEDVGDLVEGKGNLTLPETSAALLLDPRNEAACKATIRYLLDKKDWDKLTYFTPAIGAMVTAIAEEFGDGERTIPVEWLLEVASFD